MIIVSLLLLAAAPPAEYRIVEGDSCLSVAKKVSVTVAQLHQLNPGLGKPPHRLVVGSTLRTAAAPPPADARLTFLRPDVDRRPASQSAWSPAMLNEPLFKLDEVSTRRGAGAELTFLDESRLQLKENALIVVLGTSDKSPDASRRKGGGLQLVQGELSLFLAQFQTAPLEIRTPAAQVQASTREASVAVDAAKMTRVSVHEGNATVAAQGATVKVKQGEGTRIEKGKAPEKPRPLPAAPVLGEDSTRGLFATGPTGTARVTWQAVPRAKSYRVEVAREPRFVDLASSEVSETTGASVALPAGTYFVRVTAVDDLGLTSRPSSARPLNVVAMLDSAFTAGAVLASQGAEGLTLEPSQVWAAGPATLVLREGDRVLDRLPIEIAAPAFVVAAHPQGEQTLLEATATPALAAGAPLELESEGRRVAFASPMAVPTSSLEGGARVLLAGVPVAAFPPVPRPAAPVAVAVRAPEQKPCARRVVLPSSEPGALGWPSVDEAVCPSAQLLGGLESGPAGAAGQVWLGAGLPLVKGLELRGDGRLQMGRQSVLAEAGLSLDGAWAVPGLPLTVGGALGAGAVSAGPFLGRALVTAGLELGPVRLRTGQGASWRSELGLGYTGELEGVLFPGARFAWVAQGQVSWRPTLLLVDAATGPSVRLGPVDLALVATVKTRTATAPMWGAALAVNFAGAPRTP